jgi:hypothetical protein
MSETTKKFLGFVNQIAVDLGLISITQQSLVLETQAKFAALAEKGIKPTAKFLDADLLFAQVRDNWDGLASQHSVSSEDLVRNIEKAKSGKGLTKDEAPASGDIAGALKFISKEAKNAILTAQAAVRTEQALLDIDKPEAKPKTAEDLARQHGRIDYEGKFDPKTLVDAQIANKQADELHLAVKSNSIEPEQAASQRAALKLEVHRAYTNASEMFAKLDTGREIAAALAVEAKRLAPDTEIAADPKNLASPPSEIGRDGAARQ